MPVQIKIDQTGKPAGIAGFAREDLATGVGVTLSAIGGPFLAYRWRIVSKPIDILTSTRSSALLATPTASITLCTPIDVLGTHLLELTVDSGNGLGASDADIVRITFYAGPTLSATPADLPQREPAAFESLEHNVPDTLDSGGNPEGWARTWKKWFAVIRSLVPGKAWARGRITNPSGVPALLDNDGIASVVQISPGVTGVVFTTPMPDTNYSVLATGIITLASPSGFVSAQAQNLTVNGFELMTYDLTTPGASDDFDVCFRVEYVGG